MSLEKLQQRRTQLILQRYQGKEIIETSEREIAAVNFAIKNLEEYIKAEADKLNPPEEN